MGWAAIARRSIGYLGGLAVHVGAERAARFDEVAKAVLAELIDAIKEHRQPQPVPEGPYIDWEAAQVGSCS